MNVRDMGGQGRIERTERRQRAQIMVGIGWCCWTADVGVDAWKLFDGVREARGSFDAANIKVTAE